MIDKHLIGENFKRNNILVDNRYQFELFKPQHLEQVVELFTNSFCDSEPMTHYLEMDKVAYRIFARQVAEKAIEDKLSVVALDKDKVIACALVEDLAAPGDISADFDAKFINILSLLEQLGQKFFHDKKIKTKHIAHLFITAVDKDYRHQGLSRQMNFMAMDLAAANGFDFVYCEFTHIYNELGTISHLRNNKRLIGSRTYDEFHLDNKKPFAHLSGGANSYLWEIKPDAKLCYETNNQLYKEKLALNLSGL